MAVLFASSHCAESGLELWIGKRLVWRTGVRTRWRPSTTEPWIADLPITETDHESSAYRLVEQVE